MNIANIQPDDAFSIQVQIPPNSGKYTQKFSNSLGLDTTKFNYISYFSIVYDTSGFYNITNQETLTIYTNNPYYPSESGFLTIVFEPGDYTVATISDKINGESPNPYPIITIPRSGAASFRTIISYDFEIVKDGVTTPNCGNTLNFSKAPTLKTILGFYNDGSTQIEKYQNYSTYGPPINKNSIFYKTTAFSGPRNQGGRDFISPFVFDSTAGFDTIFSTCDLIQQASLIGQNYLAISSVNVRPGETFFFETNCVLPLAKFDISTINWSLYNRFNKPFNVITPITIFLRILTHKKSSPLCIRNLFPTSLVSIQVQIPPNSGKYTQKFSNGLSLDTTKFNYISRLTLIYDTAEFYNITQKQALLVKSNVGATTTKPGVLSISLEPGNYSRENILNLINRGTYPFIDIPLVGDTSFKTIIFAYENRGTALDFSNASQLQQVMGFGTETKIKTYCSSSTVIAKSSATTLVVDGTITSPNLFDEQGGFDTIYIGNDLIQQASLIGQNYLAMGNINIDPGEIFVLNSSPNMPITKTNFSVINWTLNNRLNKPFNVNGHINIYLEILSQDK